jgi:hypothetical protein
MQAHFNTPLGKVLAASLSLTGFMLAAPALAQDQSTTSTSTTTTTTTTTIMSQRRTNPSLLERSMHEQNLVNDRMTDPMPVSYPWASPGSLHLYHWTDYQEWSIKQGSVTEAREEMTNIENRALRDEIHQTDQILGIHWAEQVNRWQYPMTIEYPYASPGGLTLYHWTNYQKWNWAPGSPNEVEEQKVADRDRILRDEIHQTDQILGIHWAEQVNRWEYPMAIEYPYASPGGLTLYHWTNYQKWNWAQGSPTEVEEQKVADRNRAICDEIAQTDRILGITEDQYYVPNELIGVTMPYTTTMPNNTSSPDMPPVRTKPSVTHPATGTSGSQP